MSFDSQGAPAERPEPDEATRRSGAAPRPVRLSAGVEELVVDDIDIREAKDALARLGAQGSPDLERLSSEGAITLLAELRELAGAMAAIEARALVRLETAIMDDSLERGETPRQARKIARAEASFALKRSTSAAGQSMASCRRLVASMPGMLAALAHGRAVPAAGHQVGRAMSPATPEQRRQVDQILTTHLAHLEDCSPGEWADEAARVLHALDPEGAAARHREARRERGVTVRRGRHGMATLTAHLPGLDAARIRKTLSVSAERTRAGGDRRGHQQIMADLLVDVLLDRGEGGDLATVDIGVILTDRSLLAPAHADAATVEGLGAVPYEHVREEMLRAMETEDPDVLLALRALYKDREDGQLVAAESRARRFPRGLSHFLGLAHQTCRAPHCEAGIRQIDHIVPWSEGGATSLDNGNGLCAGDNQKEEAGVRARVVTDEHGVRRTVEWTTRYGQTARRRGVNFDPVGTAQRMLAQEVEQGRTADGAPAERSPGSDGAPAERSPGEDNAPIRPIRPSSSPPQPAEPPTMLRQLRLVTSSTAEAGDLEEPPRTGRGRRRHRPHRIDFAA